MSASNEPKLLLAPAVPNPSSGQVTLRFSLPQESAASLVLCDVLGRRIKHWQWAKLPPGPHQITWDGRAEGGQMVPPGVLFFRLDVAGQHLKQKLIHLR